MSTKKSIPNTVWSRLGRRVLRDMHRRSLLSPGFILFPISAEFLKGYLLKLHCMYINGELLLNCTS